jgi:2-polyprenyl-6-methoxyphenol hydroxylase-like FAD-dependent oxidoreductase
VLIVGAGPAGLFLAHLLTCASIPYRILEQKPTPVENTGASLGLWPQSVRVLQQLPTQLLEKLQGISAPLSNGQHLGATGDVLADRDLFKRLITNHGYPFMLFERKELLRVLWEELEDKERTARLGAKVVAVEQNADGVVVKLEDGSEERGSIVVGADGVRSRIRERMWERQGAAADADRKVLHVRYKCIYGTTARLDGVDSDVMVELHDKHLSFQMLTQPTKMFWFVYIKLEKPQQPPIWERYTDEDMEELVKTFMDHPVGQNLTFADLWNKRTRVKIANLEEGVMSTWHHERTVLLGDAVHKVTPNLAFGANNALESAVTLTNVLHELVKESTNPTSAEIDTAFQRYQSQRMKRAKACLFQASSYTSLAAYEGWGYETVLKLTLWYGDDLVQRQIGGWVKEAPRLDFLDLPEGEKEKVVRFPWCH